MCPLPQSVLRNRVLLMHLGDLISGLLHLTYVIPPVPPPLVLTPRLRHHEAQAKRAALAEVLALQAGDDEEAVRPPAASNPKPYMLRPPPSTSMRARVLHPFVAQGGRASLRLSSPAPPPPRPAG